MTIIIGSIVFIGIILAVNYEDVLEVVDNWKHHPPTLESSICDIELLDDGK